MQVVSSPRELQLRADAERRGGRRIALVPTMGALHAGHLSLISEARKRADRVWLSVFVNPTQFDQEQDFAGYPRELERDLDVCRSQGVDLVYAPAVEDAYPEGCQTWIDVTELSQPLCGRSRVGHFRGVATIVCKLLLSAKPHLVLFGEKDFQQLALLRRMVRDLGFDVEVIGCPTVREPDGLALSSRNQHLGPKARAQAPVLVRALDEAQAAVAAGERSTRVLLERARARIAMGSVWCRNGVWSSSDRSHSIRRAWLLGGMIRMATCVFRLGVCSVWVSQSMFRVVLRIPLGW